MSIIKSEDGKKWINSFIAIVSILAGFVTIRFMETMGEFFDLEAKVKYFLMISQGIGILVGLTTFVAILKNKNASTHMNEVYAELVKVVWPDKDSVVKVTIGIIIGVSIVSSIFVGVDFTFRKILELIY
ncbi:MAG: preprotein translocase subunit SecE [Deltaproteobacteria bacterium]|nr:MAG: preprotein translocase subunit SecE [Deltaproteobacteria bacterium]TNF28043.1 MAG: preprotein translocase subunit SecE [Deltaproteobacteria bacterium]